MMIIYKFDKS